MSNTRILYLLMVVTALAFVGRLLAKNFREDWEQAITDHKLAWKEIWETCEDLSFRREKAPKGTEQLRFRKHFQTQSYDARMGMVGVDTKDGTSRNFDDKVFTITWEQENASYSRQQLRLFMFNSELRYPRMRVTAFEIIPAPPNALRSSKIKTGADRDDTWKVNAMQFKQRSPLSN